LPDECGRLAHERSLTARGNGSLLRLSLSTRLSFRSILGNCRIGATAEYWFALLKQISF
jgi:hypothetical protein